MEFPSNLEAMFAAGYEYARWENCPMCGLPVELYTTPGKREISMEPMVSYSSPAVRHYYQCNITPKQDENKKISLYGVNDPNHQLLAVGWSDGNLVCQFKTAKWIYSGVPEAEFMKLRRAPYAYRIFTSNIKGKYPETKVG